MLVSSGITGLDKLLYGGFLRNSSILLEGVPGAGKTTIGLQFIYKGIIEKNEPGIVITFEELPEQLYRDANNFGWNLQQLEEQNMLRVICTSPELILDSESGLLESAIREIGAKRLLLDSATQLSLNFTDYSEIRKSVYSICTGLKRMGLTSILIKEIDCYNYTHQIPFEEYIVDTVVRLYFDESFKQRKRYLEVLKSRGKDFVSGKNVFIIDDQGISVVSLHAPDELNKNELVIQPDRLSTGVDGLDSILSGGWLKGHTILLEGDSGAGKSVMGFQYLLKGTCQQQKCLLVATEESSVFFKQYLYSFNIEHAYLETVFHNQDIRIIDMLFTRNSIEEAINEIVDTVRKNNITRVVIDFVNTFVELGDNHLTLKSHLRSLIRALNFMECTTILILNEDNSSTISLKNIIQPLVQGEIHLRSTVQNGRQYRSLEIRKMKGQQFISGVHLAEISQNGIEVFRRLGGYTRE